MNTILLKGTEFLFLPSQINVIFKNIIFCHRMYQSIILYRIIKVQ